MIGFFTDNWIVILLTYLVGLISAAHAIIYIKTPQSAVAWSLTLFFIPYIALPLYLMFSYVRFRQFIKDYRRSLKTCDDLYKDVWDQIAMFYEENTQPTAYDSIDTTLSGTNKYPLTEGHDITLLKNGRATYDALHKQIKQAKSYVLITYFLVRADREGQALRDLLLQKAEEGVDIYFLYDEQGCSNTDKRFWQSFTHEDIHLSGFNAIHGPHTLLHYNFRNHRKLVVVDGEYAFTGGLNIGNDYCGEGAKFDHWRDSHIGFSGPAVLTMQKCFCRDWYWATGEILELSWTFPQLKKSKQNECSLQAMPTYPTRHRSASLYVYLAIINSAKQRIWLTSPYFIPVPEIFAALKHAVLRGVDVKIIIPKNSDQLHTYYAEITYINKALHAGLDVLLYKEGFMHQKTILVDDNFCGIGSMNMDYRSIDLNFEIMALSRCPNFCKQMDEMLCEDLEYCINVKGRYFRKQPLYIRLIAHFIRLFSPIL